jgi:hypothetical protein
MIGDGICMGGDFLVDCVMVIGGEDGTKLEDGIRYVDDVSWLEGVSKIILVNMLVATMLSVDIPPLVLVIIGILGDKIVLFSLTHLLFTVLLKPIGHCFKQFKSTPELE